MSKAALKRYEAACNELVSLFVKKQGIEFDYWVSDEVGEIASFCGSQYFYTLSDIMYDLKNDLPKGLILQWTADSCEYNISKPQKEQRYINFRSYWMGLRFEDL
jgi:hypothetical protein